MSALVQDSLLGGEELFLLRTSEEFGKQDLMYLLDGLEG